MPPVVGVSFSLPDWAYLIGLIVAAVVVLVLFLLAFFGHWEN